jgi:hypothetical protein
MVVKLMMFLFLLLMGYFFRGTLKISCLWFTDLTDLRCAGFMFSAMMHVFFSLISSLKSSISPSAFSSRLFVS